ncbi:RagB/SusD family nutrient uptake outer membrane protein [Pedobacter nyackensis]|uniref:SusD family protein n=1 Tax=Pedobacter nyackensis TaxID=475255 RepID=A0A1W2ETB8_9SPHI|nr:RagB/SusD family nutrient uptake outer membrane protein [Pedobacter nyackensis]SMD12476.1 SusD family protein [Pedobacter nyackensis]
MNTLYKCLIVGVLMIGMYGCKKELGALPKNAKVEENTILDEATAQISLNGAYYNFANATNIKTGWQRHQILPATFAGYLGYGFGSFDDEDNLTEQSSGNYWDESYRALNAANGVIKGVNVLPDAKFTANRKKEILAQARFIRAYGHFKLLAFYAEWYKAGSTQGVLLRDELSNLTNINKARSTVKDSYDFIMADLDEAIINAPATNPSYYITKWAAMAFKMRVLMCRAGTADYTEVITLANTIMQSSPFVLEAKAEDIFHKSGLASKEVILGLKPQALQMTDPYSRSRQYWPGASSLYVAKSALKDLYANDPRQAWIIGTANPSTSAPNTFYFTKFYQQNTLPSELSETDYALRLTEVYLLKAEAIVRSGGSLADARLLVHQIQEKAGITALVNNMPYLAVETATTPAALLLEIYKETSKSLVAEDGIEWLALLRLPFATVQQLKPTITSQIQYIIPVPKAEFKYNPSFGEQNTGYAKN